MIVYPARDIHPFVMYCVNGKPCSSLLIESTDSMIFSYHYAATHTHTHTHTRTHTHTHTHTHTVPHSPLSLG